MANYLWGIDLGGTKIEAAILDADKGYEPILRTRIPTEAKGGYEHIINQIAKLVDLCRKEVGFKPEKIGIGTPGALDPQYKTMKNSNTTALNGMPLHLDLETKLGIPVKMANDANCFALAETRMGIVADEYPEAEVVFGVIMGTGVGGGVVIHGKIINGRHGIGGEWGHNFLDESGGPCYCGLTGCVETVISGAHTERYHRETFGESIKLKEIVKRHKEGSDPQSTHTVNRLLHFFGKGISSIINILDPDAIVLGGGVGNVDLLYTEGVEKAKEFAFNPYLNTAFLKPKLGDSAGVFGAAFLVE
ncbi:MAG: ROK family protein [Bacteroidota bacterium]